MADLITEYARVMKPILIVDGEGNHTGTKLNPLPVTLSGSGASGTTVQVLMDTVPVSPNDIHTPAANLAAVVTYGGVVGFRHVISGIAWSYYGGIPTGGQLTITDGGSTVFQIDIAEEGPGFFVFPYPKMASIGTVLVITLAAGGAGDNRQVKYYQSLDRGDLMSMAGMVYSHIRGRLKKTGQTTTYVLGDDGNYQRGLSQVYTVYTTDQYSGTATVDVAHYANNGISFTAPATIADTGAGLVTVLTGDIIRIRGSASNDGVYTVTAGGVAGSFTVAPNVVNEGAGAYITIYKETTISNNYVWDRRTGLGWLRNTTTGLKIGPASTGTLNWIDATTEFTLHPAAGDLQIIAAPSNILRIVGGSAEVTRYHVGDLLDLTGFATAINNLPGYRVLSVTVNGADLDIVLDPVRSTLVSEAAAGARSILLICRSIFTYCAAANAAALSGYSDWRIPNDLSLMALRYMEAPTAIPDAVAFPGWPSAGVWSSSSRSDSATNNALSPSFTTGGNVGFNKTTAIAVVLVRGGI